MVRPRAIINPIRKKERTMRKETRKIAIAFASRKAARAARTTTDGKAVELHGNRIAWFTPQDTGTGLNNIAFTLAGWPSVTTRERLNGILTVLGFPYVGIAQRQGRQCVVYKGQKVCEVEPNDVFTLSDLRQWVAESEVAA